MHSRVSLANNENNPLELGSDAHACIANKAYGLMAFHFVPLSMTEKEIADMVNTVAPHLIKHANRESTYTLRELIQESFARKNWLNKTRAITSSKQREPIYSFDRMLGSSVDLWENLGKLDVRNHAAIASVAQSIIDKHVLDFLNIEEKALFISDLIAISATAIKIMPAHNADADLKIAALKQEFSGNATACASFAGQIVRGNHQPDTNLAAILRQSLRR